MKNLLILLLLISVTAFSQENYNFKVENNQLIWQDVFESIINKSDIEEIIKKNGIFKNLVIEENIIKGNLENIAADYKGAGKSSMTTSIYVQNTTINSFFIIEFKDGKYRITLNDLILRTTNELAASGISIMSANSVEPLSKYAIKNLDLRKGFLNSDAKIYNYTFTNIFDFSKYQIKQNDW